MTSIRRLSLFGLATGLAMCSVAGAAGALDAPRIVTITASKFRFTPDQITLVQDEPVTLRLTSADRVHGFLLRALKVDTDIQPGTIKEITVTPHQTGTFKAICDHYCGLGHGNMKMTVVVIEGTSNVSNTASSKIQLNRAGSRS